jgi:PilZ domain-containing protein
VPVELHLEGDTATIRTVATNLNLGGCFLKMMFSLELGTKLELVLELPDGNVNARGVVVSRFRNLGNGIHFSKMSPNQTPKLEQFLGPSPIKAHTKST